ncbi:MAG: hypothetical protein J5494_06770, partial [Candidatus Methanomethylophilaceae archaeon]|nr:hypothetical protein [Candidatus Methanomethylophilaceae archaeon]
MQSAPVKKSRPDDFREAWMNIFRYIGKYKYMFFLTAALSAAASVLSLLGPYYISELTNLIQEGLDSAMDMDRIGEIGTLLIAMYLISGLFSFFE